MTLIDSNGCLTPAGIEAVRSAPPGEIPPDLAGHLATCEGCQGRVLADGAPTIVRAAPPTYRATLATIVVIMMAIITLVIAVQILGNR